MAKSFQQIEDYYLRQGLKGEALRNALRNDTDYQKLLNKKKAAFKTKYGITDQEEKKYLLPLEEDYKILSIVKALENKSLSATDRELVVLIKTQLEDDWRRQLLEKLKEIQQKYS